MSLVSDSVHCESQCRPLGEGRLAVFSWHKLQALVYDILPSTTGVFCYAIGPWKLSPNEQFFCWCSNSSKFVTNNSNYIRRLFYNWPVLTPAQIKPKSFESRRNFLPFFYPRWMRLMFTCVLPQFYQYPNRSEVADRVGGQLRGDKEYPFSGVTKSGRVWRKMPESDARSVLLAV